MKRGPDANVIITLFKVDRSTNICGRVYHMPLKTDEPGQMPKKFRFVFLKASEAICVQAAVSEEAPERRLTFQSAARIRRGNAHWRGAEARLELQGAKLSRGGIT